jgi:energy-coupling factor transporter transmembrane protein EcfT
MRSFWRWFGLPVALGSFSVATDAFDFGFAVVFAFGVGFAVVFFAIGFFAVAFFAVGFFVPVVFVVFAMIFFSSLLFFHQSN